MASSRILLMAVVVCLLALGAHVSSQSANNCPTACTFELRPQCGRKADGSTIEFSNPCLQEIHNCNNPGEIVSSQSGRCPT